MNAYFALNTPEIKVDPEINIIFLFLMGLFLVAFLGLLAWHFAPVLVSRSRNKRAERIKAENAIWFDSVESELHCGHNKKRIEPKSFEHFVCKITFKAPGKYHTDLDIFEEVDRAKGVRETRRGVEHAVRRLNDKARELGLMDDLFKRRKESTSVNDEYRQRIVKN